jgi:SAM-dependent methyltransferase
LNNITGTPQYVSWIISILRPHVKDTVLELGAGIGNITGRLMGKRQQYIASERDPLYLHALSNRFLRTPNVSVRSIDPGTPGDFKDLRHNVDSVLCLNVLEYVPDPATTLRSIHHTLKPDGTLLVLVPQGTGLYGTIDETLGHKRRFQAEDFCELLGTAGFTIVSLHQLNKISKPAWWLYGRLLKRKHISKITLKLFDKTVWLWRRVDFLFPWSGLSLIAVARASSESCEPSHSIIEAESLLSETSQTR